MIIFFVEFEKNFLNFAYKERDPFWIDQVNQPFYMLASIESLIQTVIVQPIKKQQATSLKFSIDEKSIMSYSLDLICTYLVELQSVTNITTEDKNRIDNLNSLKSTIEYLGAHSSL